MLKAEIGPERLWRTESTAKYLLAPVRKWGENAGLKMRMNVSDVGGNG
jgi:hypothetical protein